MKVFQTSGDWVALVVGSEHAYGSELLLLSVLRWCCVGGGCSVIELLDDFLIAKARHDPPTQSSGFWFTGSLKVRVFWV